MASEVEQRVAAVGSRQHGVVTRSQLLGAGLKVAEIRARLRSGRLVRVHRAVYLLGSLVGPLRPHRYREMAAVLACGRGAAVSHRSALWLHELTAGRSAGPVHVVLEGGRCRQAGIVAHRVASLPNRDVDEVDGIPATGVMRTILDVAGDATHQELERVVARAERSDLLDINALRERVHREPGRHGMPLLRALLGRPESPALTRSPAEDRFLEMVREAGLPEPRCNVLVGGRELDFFWAEHDVAVEVDGFAYHRSRRSFEGDRDRDLALAARGTDVHRVTWRQIENEPLVVVRRLTAILTRAEVRRERAAAWGSGQRGSGRQNSGRGG